MKLFFSLFAFLVVMSAQLPAGLAPMAALNEKKVAFAHNVCVCEKDDTMLHIASYPNGKILTVLSGPDVGYQWIEENEVFKDHSFDVEWHNHSFTHKYTGGKVVSYTKDHGKLRGQKIVYYKKARD